MTPPRGQPRRRVEANQVRALAVGAGLLLATALPAQEAELLRRIIANAETGYVALHQAVLDARTDWTAAVVVSHPDDIWSLPAAYLRFQSGWRVHVVLMTRGEGGQNSRGPELGDELGRLRTLEAEAAAARLGVTLWHAKLRDDGFCRSGADAIAVWGRDVAVRRLAELLRRIAPDVVLTPHQEEDNHGNDLAVLEILPEAVRLAGDAKATRVRGAPIAIPRLFRMPVPERPGDLQLPVDQIEFARGDTLRRLAYAALGEHRSQMPIEPIDVLMEPAFRLESMLPGEGARSLTEGLRTVYELLPETVDRAALRAALEAGLERSLSEPSVLVQRALEVRARLQAVPREPGTELDLRLRRRLEALERVVLHGSGVRAAVELPPDSVAVAGEPLAFTIQIHNGGLHRLEDVRVHGGEELPLEFSAARRDGGIQVAPRGGTAVHVRATPALQMEDGPLGPIPTERYRPPIAVELGFRLSGQEFRMPLWVPVSLRPPLDLQVTPRALLVVPGRGEVRFALQVRRNTARPLTTRLALRAPAGFVADLPGTVLLDEARLATVDVTLRVPEDLAPGVVPLQLSANDERLQVLLHKVDARVPAGLRVGLVRGVDDTAESVLRALGVDLVLLGAEDLMVGRLEGLATILVDSRALGRQEAARAAFARLLEFARQGGRLVVFYHKDVEFNAEAAGVRAAPFPLRLGKGRVTREDAPVRVLRAEHPLLTV
ncbi:MAG: PIG-L family deacetylase, partial [Planctomycetes bacterium]|nr:PIG-L family deacetylase [Planctomycetota bacterium]